MIPVYLMSTGSRYDYLHEKIAECDRLYNEIQQLYHESYLNSGEYERLQKDPEWIAWHSCFDLRWRLNKADGFDNLPYPVYGEKPELYRQRLRKAIAERRARAACLDLRRRLMERGMRHIPLPRDSETPEDYRRRIRTARKILADRRK